MDKRFPENYPAKGGRTTNFEIPDWMFKREYAEYLLEKQEEKKHES